MQYKRAFVAGTFDGLHAGHQYLLTQAFSLGEHVTIGLTSDKFVTKFKIKKLKVKIKSYKMRGRALEKWLHNQQKRATIIPINDPYEPLASTEGEGAMLVTAQNRKRGEEINALRQKRGLVSLTLVEVPIISASDGLPISSTRIRSGEIDREGKLVMPETLRPLLVKPLGRILENEEIIKSFIKHKGKTIVTVGDVATKTALDAGITPALAIVDNKVGRKSFYGLFKYRQTALAHTTKVQSGPGYISKSALALIKQGKAGVIEVEGEEDLLTVPAVRYAALGSVVYYGQPQIGLVEVEVTRKKKQEAGKLLSQFVS